MTKQKVEANPIEVLGLSAAEINGRPNIVVTVRLNPPSWASNNLAITKEQAIRLRDELDALLKSPTMTKEPKKKK